MSLLKSNSVQIGQSSVASQNFTLTVPNSPDGTLKISRGNSGATTQDILSVDANGNTDLKFTQTSGAQRSMISKLKDVVSVKDFGAVGDGVTDDTAAIQAAFAFGSAYGIKIQAPAGTYSINNIIQWSISNGFHLECEVGTIFKAASIFPANTAFFKPIEGISSSKKFIWKNGVIDGRLRPTKTIISAPDLLYIAGNFSNVLIDNVSFLSNDTRTGLSGDSCLFLSEGNNYKITNCTFQGGIDSGIYISGNAAQTLGKTCICANNTFIECVVGIISKRKFKNYIVSNNLLENCDYGISTGPADGTLLPGYKNIISNNILNSCLVPIFIQVSDYTIVHDNIIENHGIDSSGVSVGNAAIALYGSSYCNVHHNIVSRPTAGALSGICAVLLGDLTYNSITYISKNNIIDANQILDCNVGIKELSGSGSDYNIITGTNKYLNCSTITSLVGSNTKTGFLIEGTTPNIVFNKQDSATNEKIWRLNQTSNNLQISSRNDDNTTGGIIFSATRTGSSITNLQFGSNYGSLVFDSSNGATLTNTTGININGSTTFNSGTVNIHGNITGSISKNAILADQIIQSDVTSIVYNFLSQPGLQSANFTLSGLTHFGAAQQTLTGGSSITNQYGFVSSSGLIGATNNYGFYGNIPSGIGRWNFYAANTAPNYFAGVTTIGSTATAGTGTILDIQSTSAGVRFPNMTTTQKTAITPAAGTMVFDTTLSKLCIYTGSAWQTITSA